MARIVSPYPGRPAQSDGSLGRYTQILKLRDRVLSTAELLDQVSSIAFDLFTDDIFLTLLRAECMFATPRYILERARNHNGTREA